VLSLDVSGSSPLVVDRTQERVVARSVTEFFHYLKQRPETTLPVASWSGMCMCYLLAFECLRRGEGLSNTALSRRGDPVSFPFGRSEVLTAFQNGLRTGEEMLLQERTHGEEYALDRLAARLG